MLLKVKVYIFFFLIFIFDITLAFHSVSPLGKIFGLSPGFYVGEGNLISKGPIPNLKFLSYRTLESKIDSSGNIIGYLSAKTMASFSMFNLGKAEAQLVIKMIPNNHSKFFLFDAKSNNQVGSGYCQSQDLINYCTFSATIMNGKLYLKETWEINDSGFYLKNGYQKLNNIESQYEGFFHLSNHEL